MNHIRAEDSARPTTDLTGHRALMAAVLTQIIKDALMIPKTAEDRRERDLSQRMIRNCGKWFRQICDCAGVDPEAVRDRFAAGKIAPPAQNVAVQPTNSRTLAMQARRAKVARLLAEGHSQNHIAAILGATRDTIRHDYYALRHNRRKAPGTPEKSPASGQVASGRYHGAKNAASPPAAKSGAVATVTKMGMVAE